jgi:hypothetical protein
VSEGAVSMIEIVGLIGIEPMTSPSDRFVHRQTTLVRRLIHGWVISSADWW